MTELRPYQVNFIADVKANVAAGRRRVLGVAPTGAGKTVIAVEIIRDAVARGKRVLILVDRREHTKQWSEKLHAAGIDHGIVQAGFPTRPGAKVQLASVQTLHARAVRSDGMGLPDADLVIVDEAHHVRARTYRQIVDAYPNASVLGLTATPCRGDGRGLGTIFDVLVECASVAELIATNFLVPTRVFAPATPDLKGVKTERGDYVVQQLAQRVDQPKLVADIPTSWLKHGDRRRTVCFATNVSHSLHIRDSFRAVGVLAEHVDGSTPLDERDAILAKLKSGTVELVTNVGVLCEGWDQPEVSCLILARPTKSFGLFRQMAGRVLRPAPDKVDALILDHAGAIHEHGFVEDEIGWTLSSDKRADNPAQAARATNPTLALSTCPECSAIRIGGQPCPSCGYRPQPKSKPVHVADGELGEVDRNRKVKAQDWTSDQKLQFYRQLVWIARERGYREGWAAHKFREKFGHWPASRLVTPLTPDAATSAWVRSRQIAYARGMARGVA